MQGKLILRYNEGKQLWTWKDNLFLIETSRGLFCKIQQGSKTRIHVMSFPSRVVIEF